MNGMRAKNRRLGWMLALIAVGMAVYSFAVISSRGNLTEPAGLSRLQRIWRGL